jgi:ATP-binding cassette, subfamily C, bacterial
MTAGTLMGGLTYVLVGLQPALHTVMAALGDSGLRYVVTLGRILDAETAPSPRTSVDPLGHEVTIRGLTFRYGPAAEPVLENLDLTVRPGDHLAVVGPSGIGKSTLAGLICGLLTPSDGRVLVGGVPATSTSAETRVLIPQEAYVFSDTLLANLSYLCPSTSPAQVRNAVYAVGAGALLGRPGGLNGQIRPGDLSAGERQLIALVRAYLSPAPLAVLDEATCHLDPEAERRAEEAFAARTGTLIVIAHRISSALRADRVLVLDGNRAAIGDHATLLRTSRLYRELLGYWQHSDPAGVRGDPDRLDPGPGPGLGQDPGQVVAHGSGAQ